MKDSLQVGGRTFEPRRIFCIGKNYARHVRELGGQVPGFPVVFMKPVTSLVLPGVPVRTPEHGAELHHEAEVVVLIGRGGRAISEAAAVGHIAGLALGLDLTLRDVQAQLKAKGLPWEVSKAFDQSAPLGPVMPWNPEGNLAAISFQCRVGDEVRQTGNTGDMMFSIPYLIHYLSGIWQLEPGDLIYTGTPEGVGPLQAGNTVSLDSPLLPGASWRIV